MSARTAKWALLFGAALNVIVSGLGDKGWAAVPNLLLAGVCCVAFGVMWERYPKRAHAMNTLSAVAVTLFRLTILASLAYSLRAIWRTGGCLRWIGFAFLAGMLLLGCAPAPAPAAHRPVPGTSPPVTIEQGSDLPTTTTTEPEPEPEPTAAPTTGPPPPAISLLVIDDHPHSQAGYRRDAWPTWLDPDHNGCDAREDALIAASTIRATVGAGCKVTAGHWVSAYDGAETDTAGSFDVDHVVPLADAYRSGGWAWDTARRAAYANDPADLWVVSATSNRSKGDQDPSTWRPPRQDVWCLYAVRWTAIKVRWQLTATSAERDALGQMKETCP